MLDYTLDFSTLSVVSWLLAQKPDELIGYVILLFQFVLLVIRFIITIKSKNTPERKIEALNDGLKILEEFNDKIQNGKK
ncbi:hypothetical protein [Capybara microvirus Cap3_SP_562]|nr:hypothetical protein [Capybara microvirus Cap3_SP_562]